MLITITYSECEYSAALSYNTKNYLLAGSLVWKFVMSVHL